MTTDLRAPSLSARAKHLSVLMILIGFVVFLGGIIDAPDRIWPNVLLVFYYLLCLGLSGVFFVALQHVTGASWSVVLRRVPEAMTSLVPLAGIGLFGVLFLHPSLYPWTAHQGETVRPGLVFKEIWLDLDFFRLRSLIYLVLWFGFGLALVRTSLRQDSEGEKGHERRNVRLSAAFLVVFAFSYWMASYDWIMSLDPHWYSTLFGVYNFAGLFLGGLAAITILVVWLCRSGPLRGAVTEEHLHDLGKLLFAFSTFWMYIWFCQYMLIWYTNIPEETGYFIVRQQGAFRLLFLLNIILNWALPFTVLLLGAAKRSGSVLVMVSVVVLLGRWLDLYLMILPPRSGGGPIFGIWEVGLLPGAAALFFLVFHRALRKASLVPIHDPRLGASLRHHQ